jgi:hypothetical protein
MTPPVQNPALLDQWRALWLALHRLAPAHASPTRYAYPPASAPAEPFQPDAHYFRVRISELYLAHQQQWLSHYDPLLLAVTEFVYGSQPIALPVVLGPTALAARMHKAAAGIVCRDIPVTGWQPYRGGPLALALVLCRVPRGGQAAPLLHLSEQLASALHTVPTSTAAHLASTVLQSVQALLGQGQLTPLFGARSVLAPQEHSPAPGYTALLAEPPCSPAHVQAGSLHTGSEPHHQADYIVSELCQAHERDDLAALPFYHLYEQTLREGAAPGNRGWQRAKGSMLAFFAAMLQQPDLTPTQANALRKACVRDLKHQRRQLAQHPTAPEMQTEIAL